MQHPDPATRNPHRHHDESGDSASAGTTTTTDTLTYPISPDYVKSWTPVRALCELIANALDEDRDARISWADGVLTISDRGPGIPEEGLVLGYSTKTEDQIGQFGEGKKIAYLVLARSPEIGAVRCETVGYGFTPTVERHRLLEGLIPSRSGQGAEVLVYHLYRTDRTHGTLITVTCSQELAEEAISRFRALTEPDYAPPLPPGRCVLDGAAGRIWIGGVLVTTVPGLHASYDLPLGDKALQNRDRTVIDAVALRGAVRTILATSEDQAVIDRFATHALAGGALREPEQFFERVHHPRARAAWRIWARTHLAAQTFYNGSGNEEAALHLVDIGYTEVAARGLSTYDQRAFMDLLGVEIAKQKQARHYERNRDKTTWVPEKSLTHAERALLAEASDLVRRAIGAFALDRVRVYSDSAETPCAVGFYTPRNGDVAIRRDTLANRHLTLGTLLHEAAHRVGHRGGGRWMPVPDYGDRCRGFENLLTEFGSLLLGYLVDGGVLPEPSAAPQPAPSPQRRRSAADDPAVPISRRELAHLLADRLPEALTSKGFADVKDMISSTAVHPDYWRTLTNPKTAGHRQVRGGRAWDYDKVALLAEAVGVHPPVVWLGYHLCEGPMRGRRRKNWGQPGPWATAMREATVRACEDLAALGGAYAEQIPALRALMEGVTPTPSGEDSWQAPARALVGLERKRLGLTVEPNQS
ncbi:hypothetical protein C1I95_23660 [Micromonospora craterilacus]|uniref:Uncharacterized protein n=1 Tax=Micromonospora craterilacus TaxID=1655439 RepID=A0A2W2DS88_9ACTN|nr:hypothetical protein [Micromonospora craterilacus]PZG13453.1 hypothetical protein C1I95_23660 [Micromonospora craterilacus]